MPARKPTVLLTSALIACGQPSRAPAPPDRPPPPAQATAVTADASVPADVSRVAPDIRFPASTSTPFRAGPASNDAPTTVPATCTKPGVVLELPPSASSTCSTPSCLVEVPFRIVNCTAEAIVPASLALVTDGPYAELGRLAPEVAIEMAAELSERDPVNVQVPILGAPTVAPQSTLRGFAVMLRAGARWEVTLVAANTAHDAVPSPPSATHVPDHALMAKVKKALGERATRQADCKKHGGSFEIVGGFDASEKCVFPFPDAGKACHDKAHCRGDCLLTKAVPLPGGKVRLDGQCSRLETTFGCAARLGHTPGASGVVAAGHVPPSMCID